MAAVSTAVARKTFARLPLWVAVPASGGRHRKAFLCGACSGNVLQSIAKPPSPDQTMCNLYSQTKSQDAMRHVFDDMIEAGENFEDLAGNLPPMAGIFPDYQAPILRHGACDGWQLVKARWGMPTPQVFLEGKRTDPGVTNIRNVASAHWRRWLGVQNRCLVPFTSFSEIDARPGAPRNHPVWFALGSSRPLAFFAGLHTEWTSVRKLKEGEVTAGVFGFLTCTPNREVGPVHPKAMPVILTTPAEWRWWLTAPAADALQLQRPLLDGMLQIVAEGGREDAA
jgi:putative SOS response-associated peptidase YedK